MVSALGSQATGGPSIGSLIREDPSCRQLLIQSIAQRDPALAQKIKENPMPFEMALQKSTIEGAVLTSEDKKTVDYVSNVLVDLVASFQHFCSCEISAFRGRRP